MIEKAHAKVNIFLKIVGTREEYHELLSRFVRVENLYDTISFKATPYHDNFQLQGQFGCTTEKNTIYKAYLLLKEINPKVENFFKTHQVDVEKQIPEFAGLGGGSSDAAAFLRMSNRILDLGLSTELLATMGAKIGADVPFFVYNYTSANVSGIGEIVEPFEEASLDIETFTPKIACDTVAVYQAFRQDFLNQIDIPFAMALKDEESKVLLQNKDALFLNDLFAPALSLYPELKNYHDKNFFSGSGSTFFRSKHG
jgi:4-diphosphocytidyl-2-C-methyl-D-erythritol kinase